MKNQNGLNPKSFILRVWNDEPEVGKKPRWRYVLLDTETDSRRGFSSLDQLFITLYRKISGDDSTTLAADQEDCMRSTHSHL